MTEEKEREVRNVWQSFLRLELSVKLRAKKGEKIEAVREGEIHEVIVIYLLFFLSGERSPIVTPKK